VEELELTIIELLKNQEYYGHLIQQFNRIFSKTIPTAGVSYNKGKFSLTINEDFFKSLSKKEREAVLIHECLHCLNHHLVRRNKYSIKEYRLLNVAMDMAINTFISNLPEKALLPKEEWEKNREFEYYYDKLKEEQEKCDQNGEGPGETLDDHSQWGDVSEEELDAAIKEAANRAASKTKGNLPANIQLLLDKMNKNSVDWKKVLKRYIGLAEKEIKLQTKMKRNRRYGITYPGWRVEPQLNVYVAVDVSGSVPDNYVNQFFGEINKIVDKKDINVEVFEVDMQINQRYTFKKNQQIKVLGRGGTDYNIFFEGIKAEKPDLIIYFGDGESSPVQKKPNAPVLWAMMPGCTPPNEWGKKLEVTLNE